MATKLTTSRRKFLSDWDEIEYLYLKLLFWLYERNDAHSALRFCGRLQNLLRKADSKQKSVFGQECRSLIAEANGDLSRAIRHREREIATIRRLWEISRNTPGWEIAMREYGPSDLSDRMDLLAILYHDAGDFETAIRVLNESEAFCKSEGIPFDGAEVLQDIRADLPLQTARPQTDRNGHSSRVTNSRATVRRPRRLAQSNK